MSVNNASKENQEAVKEYLKTRKVLIVDPSTTTHSGLYDIFQDLGAPPNNIILANTFSQGESLVVSEKPSVVVAEFNIGTHSGLELLQKQREQRPKENKETIFVIVTSNTSQSAVAQAVEENIDAYVIKPYTLDSVQLILSNAIARKVRPPEYDLVIEEGKKLLEEGKFKEADEKFTKATQLNSSPSLAYYYLGYLKYIQDFLKESKDQYTAGLQYNNIHYKCLIGLYELFMAEKEHEKAYEVARKITENFPTTSKRLSEVLRLAILSGKFQDIEEYYQIFTQIDEKDETLIHHVCAALIVCGKHFLTTKKDVNKALDLFRKATKTGKSRSSFIKEIILSLLEHDLLKESVSFLSQFLPEDQKSADFLVCQLLIKSKNGLSSQATIQEGQALLNQGIVSHDLYLLMIKNLVESSQMDAAKNLATTASNHFPKEKTHYEMQLKKQ